MTNPPYPSLVLGIHSTRRCGKDTLFSHLAALEPTCVRYAYADALKEDLADFIREKYGFEPDNLTPEQKEIVRFLYIGYGMSRRAENVDYWVNIVAANIWHRWTWTDIPFIPVVTDVRFESEVAAMRREFGSSFTLINLTRDGAPPPTDEEEKHYRQVAAMADFHLHWGNDTPEQQRAHAQRLWDWLSAEAEQKAA